MAQDPDVEGVPWLGDPARAVVGEDLDTLIHAFAEDHRLPLIFLERDADGQATFHPEYPGRIQHLNPFCRYIRQTPTINRRCLDDYARNAERVLKKLDETPEEERGKVLDFYCCHMGLLCIAAPLASPRSVCFAGQVRDEANDGLVLGCVEALTDDDELVKADGPVEYGKLHMLMDQIPRMGGEELSTAGISLRLFNEQLRRAYVSAAAQNFATWEAALVDRISRSLGLRDASDSDEIAAGMQRVCEEIRDLGRLELCALYLVDIRAPRIMDRVTAAPDAAIGGLPVRLASRAVTDHQVEEGSPVVAVLPPENMEAIAGDFRTVQAGSGEKVFPEGSEGVCINLDGQPVGLFVIRRGEQPECNTMAEALRRTLARIVILRVQTHRLVVDREDRSRELAHEMNALVHGLRGSIGLVGARMDRAAEELGDGSPESFQGALKARGSLEQKGMLLYRKMANVGFLTPTSDGQREPVRRQTSVWGPVKRATDFLEDLAAHWRIEVRLDDYMSQLPSIYMVETQIELAFSNLMHNALKYSHRGNPRRGLRRWVDVSGFDVPGHKRLQERHIEVYVSDYGMGIAPYELEAVFEPWVQGSVRDPKREIDGTGTGLAVARRLIEDHGGLVSLRCTPQPDTNARQDQWRALTPETPNDAKMAVLQNCLVECTVCLPFGRE